MSLIKRIDEDIIKALKSGDSDAATTLRGLKSDIKYRQIEKKPDDLTEDEIILVLSSAAKRRRDSIDQFADAGRDDLATKETAELELIKTYLPQQLSEAEIETLSLEVLAETGASVPSDMGKVMKAMMPKVRGRADGKMVKSVVTRLLNSQ